MDLRLSDFDYVLPPELIAAFPPKERSSARLLSIDRKTGKFSHHTFRDIAQFLRPGDVLVLNNTKVIPARLFGVRQSGGKVEGLLLKEIGKGEWKALLKPGGRIKKGAEIVFGNDAITLEAKVLDDAAPDSGERTLGFFGPDPKSVIAKIGHIPLPPYIDRPDIPLDREMYQTVFAEKEGAVASPTAGLHFDQALLKELEKKGIEIVYVTLHVSYGTFAPVAVEDLKTHKMFSEEYEVTEEAAAKINQALNEKRRVIACGTTSVRTLESAVSSPHPCLSGRQASLSRERERVQAGKGETQLFIYPPYDFKVVQGMITNFHLPKSTLLLLVAALMGKDRLMEAYQEAIREKYRFYSYGDAMFIA